MTVESSRVLKSAINDTYLCQFYMSKCFIGMLNLLSIKFLNISKNKFSVIINSELTMNKLAFVSNHIYVTLQRYFNLKNVNNHASLSEIWQQGLFLTTMTKLS